MGQFKEYRWEIEEVGQGHYYLNLEDCLRDAKQASEDHLTDTILVELFRPQRIVIAHYVAGKENNPWRTT